MRVQYYFFVVVVADVAKFIKDFHVYIFFTREVLRKQWQKFLDGDFACVEEIFHGTHELDELLGDGVESSGSD